MSQPCVIRLYYKFINRDKCICKVGQKVVDKKASLNL